MSAQHLDRKFATDVAWNYGSMAVIGIGGLALNLYIAAAHGPLALGVFNQIYAVFIILAQVAAWGIHYAAQKHAAEFADDRRVVGSVTASAAAMAAVSGTLTMLAVAAGRPLLLSYFKSTDVADGLMLAAPGLLLIALNKVLLGVANGLRHMRGFAVVQALRIVLLAGVAVTVLETGLSLAWLGAAFSAAEFGVLLGVAMHLLPKLARPVGRGMCAWARIQLPFATRSLPTGLLLEANFRIDVVVLGACASDRAVGVYSLAATVAEGLYGLLHVLRVNVNPLLVDLSKPERHEALAALVRRLRLAIYPGMGVLMAVMLAGAFLAQRWLPRGAEFADSLAVLAVLCLGIWLYSGFAPFDFILLQSGRPGRQTLVVLLQVATTLAVNLALVPVFGVLGAAWAMALSFALAAVWLSLCAARWLGFNLARLPPRLCPL